MRAAACLLGGALAGCGTEFTIPPSRIDEPVVIAVAIDPPEAVPGAEVTLTVTVAGPDGPVTADDARWALCTSPRPIADNNAVPAACLGDDGVALIAGAGASVTARLSTTACGLFGPNPPPGGFRPRDPDPTGGYYQPVRVAADEVARPAFGMARLFCQLANAPLEVSRRYADEYQRNLAPAIAAIDGVPATVAPGTTLGLTVTWPAGTAEPYLRYDPAQRDLVEATERLTVSWYGTGGSFYLDRTEGDVGGSSNGWTVGAEPGPSYLWAVVRDDRGGVGVISAVVEVEPGG